MIALTPEAATRVDTLERFTIGKGRPRALRTPGHASAEAGLIVANAPERGLPAPRPHPGLAALGLSWLKRGRCWIAYDPTLPIIAGVFSETDDIPNRLG